jgi:hypothetical protein
MFPAFGPPKAQNKRMRGQSGNGKYRVQVRSNKFGPRSTPKRERGTRQSFDEPFVESDTEQRAILAAGDDADSGIFVVDANISKLSTTNGTAQD